MARRIYFAFHYQKDIWRVNQVRNSWVTVDREEAGYYDKSLWEEAQKTNDIGIKRMINGGLYGTTATCVLIGSETYKRPWVQYEIIKSLERGNGLFGVKIHHLKNSLQETCDAGNDPFDDIQITVSALGKSASVKVWKNATWTDFDKCPKIERSFPQSMHGTTHRLSKLGLKSYDWVYSNGFQNLSTWVEDSIKSIV